MTRSIFFLLPAVLIFFGCQQQKTMTDLIIKNATVYTVDSLFSKADAFAVSDGRIVATGSNRSIEKQYTAKKVIDMKGRFIYPGWIDAHCHFYGYGLSLKTADLTGSASAEEVVQRIKEFCPEAEGNWITGRGWDQNLWETKDYPDRRLLDEAFPSTPLFLRRIDGHAAWVNSEALRRAGISEETRIEGGTFLKRDGRLTGILIDNAVDFVDSRIPPPGRSGMEEAYSAAEKNCLAKGLTSVGDAGLSFAEVMLADSMQKAGILKMRINAMLNPSDENMSGFIQNGPYSTDRLNVRTIKLYADGALGSRGARMKESYSDDPGNYGLWVTAPERMEKLCRIAYNTGYQVATHCIGDQANRTVLDIYGNLLQGHNDRRWRIEHAQIVDPADIPLFGKYSIIPSVQTTHATSDMGWAEVRIGPERMEGAYAYHDLLGQIGWIPNGSDFPVEDINPLYGFYAAVTRKDREGNPDGGFLYRNSLSREEALRAMTIWAAKASFDESNRGSLEPGKYADFVVTGEDLMQVPDENLFKIKVLQTWIGGEQLYGR